MIRTNVGKFIKDHGLGQRHYKVKSKDCITSPTALTTLNPVSENGSSWNNMRNAISPSESRTGPQ